MGFRFKFDQLLRLAIHEEDEVKNRLAFKDAQIAEEDLKIKAIESEQETALNEKAEDLLAGRMDRIRMYPIYFLRLERSRAYHQDERERLKAQREKILQELSEKRRVRKTYEKLKERHQQRFQKEELRHDQKQMDEFGARIAAIKEE